MTTNEQLRGLLKECRTTLEMWKDVAPAVSLCADIDAALAEPVLGGAVLPEPVECEGFEVFMDRKGERAVTIDSRLSVEYYDSGEIQVSLKAEYVTYRVGDVAALNGGKRMEPGNVDEISLYFAKEIEKIVFQNFAGGPAQRLAAIQVFLNKVLKMEVLPL